MKKIIAFTFAVLLFAVAQSQDIEPKKSKTCGKPMKECQYRDNHLQSNESQRKIDDNTNKTSVEPYVRMDGNDLVFTCDGTEYRYKMVYVSGGTYTMGCTSEQGSDCNSDEKPAHNVTVSSFYMGQTEVTQALWKAVMGSNLSYWKGNTLPVVDVSYNDVKEFIGKLNNLTGVTFRMPTEAEWEYAARGGNSSRGYKYSGGNDIGSVAWYYDNSGSKTHPVAQKQANELGLYDMAGNVLEWCNDWYGSYSSDSQNNPKGPSSGSRRVLRGGGWIDDARDCRVSYRDDCGPSGRNGSLGFRLAR